MSDTQTTAPTASTTRTNPARLAITITGLLLLVVGAIVAVVAGSHIGYDQSVSNYSNVLQGGDPYATGTSSALTGDYVGLWVGIGVAAFGLVLLTARIIISAAHRQES